MTGALLRRGGLGDGEIQIHREGGPVRTEAEAEGRWPQLRGACSPQELGEAGIILP